MSRRTLAIVAVLALPLACINSLIARRLANPAHPFYLELEIASDQTFFTADLEFQTAMGSQNYGNVRVPVDHSSISSFQKIKFDLPGIPIYGFLLRPLDRPGRAIVRNAAVVLNRRKVWRLSPNEIVPVFAIAHLNIVGNGAEIVTTPKSGHAKVELPVRAPIYPWPRSRYHPFRWLHLLDIPLLLLFWFYGRELCQQLMGVLRCKVEQSWLASFAKRISVPEWIEFDAWAIAFYLFCASLALLATMAKLNGSSATSYPVTEHRGAAQAELLGEPRHIRTDEWGSTTPAILFQAERRDPLAARDSWFGGHYVSLVSGVPVKHLTTLFRPQFWSFFFLPVEYAFSAYWQMKSLLFMSGVFTFLLWLTRSSYFSIAGCLWYSYSAFTQWSYSWPSELPEMVGCICWVMVLIGYLFVGRNRGALLGAAIAAAGFAIDFVMCGYLPHQIPLVWLALFVLCAQAIAFWPNIFSREGLWARLAAGLVMLVVLGAVGISVYRDLHVALTAVGDTVYPGRRLIRSGHAFPWLFPSAFLDIWETEETAPPAMGNICEGSGFLWLAPAALLMLFAVRLNKSQKLTIMAMSAVSLLILAWMLYPLPDIVGRITGFNRTFGARFLPALGLANVAIVIMVISAPRRIVVEGRRQIVVLILTGIVMSGLMWQYLQVTKHHTGSAVKPMAVFASAVLAGLLVALLAAGFRRTLAGVLVGVNLLAFWLVNPVQHGLDVFYRSELADFVQKRPELLEGKWIVYSGSVLDAGFFGTIGLDLYNSYRHIPDIDHFALFASQKYDPAAYNRLGYLLAVPDIDDSAPQSQMTVAGNGQMALWRVAPSDPILRSLNIRYAAFSMRPSDEMTNTMMPLADHPVDGFWLYRYVERSATSR